MEWTKLLNDTYRRGSGGSYHSSKINKCYFEIIRSSSFRRLQDKTQVYSMSENDYVRTRLTHSVEVAEIARYIGEIIWDKINTELVNEKGYDPKRDYKSDLLRILECAALLHDIGNPPMGHNGEYAIRSWFKDYIDLKGEKNNYKEKLRKEIKLDDQMKEDFLHFEGNAQALRVIDKLHHARGIKSGMNLSYAIPSVIIKYPIPSTEIEKNEGDYKKFGYFKDDEDFFKTIREKTGLDSAKTRNPLTYVLEAADDISYIIADIEDAYSDGLVTYEEIKKILVNYGNEIFESNNADAYLTIFEKSEEKRASQNADGKLTDDDKAEVLEMILNSTRMAYMNYAAKSFIEEYDDIVAGIFRGGDLIDQNPDAKGPHASMVEDFRELMIERVYGPRDHSPEACYYSAILKEYLDTLSDALIEEVFEIGDRYKEYVGLIPEHMKRNLKQGIKEKEKAYSSEPEKLKQWKYYLCILTATDFVSGMTDSYAVSVFRKRFNSVGEKNR